MDVLMLQSWCDLTFLHWRYPLAVVQRLVPRPLEVESFDGSAWVGIVPFLLGGLRPKFLPPLPWISRFPETNCRTYVKGPDGHSGVWFFSLDAARAVAVAGARLGYGLPYAWARMRVTREAGHLSYESTRLWPDLCSRVRIIVEPEDPIEPQPLDLFLTARFRLYSFLRGNLICANVEHAPWRLRNARLIQVDQTLTSAAGLPAPAQPPFTLYSPGVHVRIGPPETCLSGTAFLPPVNRGASPELTRRAHLE